MGNCPEILGTVVLFLDWIYLGKAQFSDTKDAQLCSGITCQAQTYFCISLSYDPYILGMKLMRLLLSLGRRAP